MVGCGRCSIPNLVILIITVTTALGPTPEHRELVPRDQCMQLARNAAKDAAFEIAHNLAMRGWVIGVGCRDVGMLPGEVGDAGR